jgi:hypothetical protein
MHVCMLVVMRCLPNAAAALAAATAALLKFQPEKGSVVRQQTRHPKHTGSCKPI